MMFGHRLLPVCCAAYLSIVSVQAQPAIDPIENIGPVGPLRTVHEGFDFKFTEGPAADAEGQLYFTDVFAGRIYQAQDSGEPRLILEKSMGMNGLMFDGQGRLFGCQGGVGKLVAIDIATGQMTPVAEQYDGIRFNRPNDLVIDRTGGIYFTDPRFGRGTQDKEGFYYATAAGAVTRLGDALKFPNGIILSPDESTLYVLPYQASQVMAYPVEAPGKIGPGRVLCTIDSGKSGKPAGGDGMTIDTEGNLYLTAPAISAIQVVSPQGATLGILPLPASPTNCTFGGSDMRTLYVTARKQIFALPMQTTGHRFGTRR